MRRWRWNFCEVLGERGLAGETGAVAMDALGSNGADGSRGSASGRGLGIHGC